MSENRSLLGRGAGMLAHNKRYVVWFYVLNAALAYFGTVAFRNQAQDILDHSLYSDRLVHGLDLTALGELFYRPEFGPMRASSLSAMSLALLFFLATALFLPGVLQGFASTYRLPREEFFRVCGRNLWRFVRLMIVAGVAMGIAAACLFGLKAALGTKSEESTNELLPFYVSLASLVVIFFVMTILRIWFDLAEVDVVLSDRRAVRKSIAAGFRHVFPSLGRLLASYVAATIAAAVVLAAGLWIWMRFVAPDNVLGAFLIGQLTLFLLLIPRFWQRAVAVAYYQEAMVVPVFPMELISSEPPVAPVVADPGPGPAPVVPSTPTGTEGSAL
jgi:hypothetical protein